MNEYFVSDLHLFDDKKSVKTKCYSFKFDVVLNVDGCEFLFVKDHKIIVKSDKKYFSIENFNKIMRIIKNETVRLDACIQE